MAALASRSAVGFRPTVAQRPAAIRPVAARVARRSSVQVSAIFGAKTEDKSFFDFSVKDIDGKNISLASYKGKVVLVVNLASACGFTPQYKELQAVFDKYSSKGFTVIGFPCNQFGAQEPGTNSDIKKFAQSNYGVKFPLMSKVDVNGPGAEPVFNYLKNAKGGLLGNDIKWNFSKFLVGKDGSVIGRYPSTTAPGQIAADIEKALAA